jgi:hypothetical protein
MNTEEFYAEKLKKAGVTLKGMAGLVTQSFEVESMVRYNEERMRDRLDRIGAGLARDNQINDGNGWNRDIHHDASLVSYTEDRSGGGMYGIETSSSPIDIIGWHNLKTYLDEILATYKQASGDVLYTVRGSTHVHNTVAYSRLNGRTVHSIKVDKNLVYNNVARFFLKFMPVMKWLVMTDRDGARGINGSSYGDKFGNDGLFYWYSNFDAKLTDDSIYHLNGLGRDSCFRIINPRAVHYENRLCDCTFSANHIAMWLSVNKAITLLAIDFSRNGFLLDIEREEVALSRELMWQHESGFNNVNKHNIETMYKRFISYIAKYLKVIGSLEAIEIMDKLIKNPISQYIHDNTQPHEQFWNTELIDKAFNTRNRACDEELRDKFIHSIKTMQVPFADSLNEFHDHLAGHLGVETKKVKSLYQMFKRENTDIEFLGGRLVYMGD